MILPLVFPAVVAGSIFTFSLTLGDYITPLLVSPDTQFIGNVVYTNITNNLPLASAFADGADRGHDRLPADRPAPGSVRAPMRLSRRSEYLLRVGVGVTLAFIYVPLIVIAHLRLQRQRRPWNGRRPALTTRVVREGASTTRAPATRS